MSYLIGEIWAHLLIALGIGILIGWAVWRGRLQAALETAASRAEHDMSQARAAFEKEKRASALAVSRLEGEAEARSEKLAALQAENVELRTRAEILEAEVRTTVEELDAGRGRTGSLEKLAQVLENDLTASRHETSTLQGRVRELEAQLATHTMSDTGDPSSVWSMRPLVGRPENTEPDDLTEIWGIGPVLERRLNSLGYFTFHDIATWDGETIQQVSDQLPEFQGRIARDDWVEQARRLYDSHHGEAQDT